MLKPFVTSKSSLRWDAPELCSCEGQLSHQPSSLQRCEMEEPTAMGSCGRGPCDGTCAFSLPCLMPSKMGVLFEHLKMSPGNLPNFDRENRVVVNHCLPQKLKSLKPVRLLLCWQHWPPSNPYPSYGLQRVDLITGVPKRCLHTPVIIIAICRKEKLPFKKTAESLCLAW